MVRSMAAPDTTARPPAQITDAHDVDALRHWAFAALAAGEGEAVIEALARLSEDALDVPSWRDARTDLQVRAGIALDVPELVMLAATELLDDGEAMTPERLLPLGVGAQWLVEEAMASAGPGVRFGLARHLLVAARWSLARALSIGDLDPARSAEGAAALDRLYATAWRVRDPLASISFDPNGPVELLELRDALAAVADADVDVRFEVASDVLWHLAQWCEPDWPVHGGPWWTSQTYGLTIEIAAPTTVAGRHRFALADVYLEIDDVEAVAGVDGLDEGAAEPLAAHLHELAVQALAHAVGSGLVRVRPPEG